MNFLKKNRDKTEQKKQNEIHHVEPINPHHVFFIVTVGAAIQQYVWNNPYNPILTNIFFGIFLMAIPIAIYLLSLKSMYHRRLWIESFFDEYYWELEEWERRKK